MPYIRNKRTGETIWVEDFGGPQMPADPTFQTKGPQARATLEGTGINNARTVVQTRGDQIDNELKRRTLAPASAKAQADASKAQADAAMARAEAARKSKAYNDARANAITELADTVRRLDGVVADSRDNGGWGETGWTGSAMRRIPGTAAYDLGQDVSTIQARAAFNNLQKMREQSPTGGAVGNVSDADMKLLQNVIGSIDPNQSQDNFEKNAGGARSTVWNMLNRLDPKTAAKYRTKGAPRSNVIRYDSNGNRIK